jgi:hypothetical protein
LPKLGTVVEHRAENGNSARRRPHAKQHTSCCGSQKAH